MQSTLFRTLSVCLSVCLSPYLVPLDVIRLDVTGRQFLTHDAVFQLSQEILSLVINSGGPGCNVNEPLRMIIVSVLVQVPDVSPEPTTLHCWV